MSFICRTVGTVVRVRKGRGRAGRHPGVICGIVVAWLLSRPAFGVPAGEQDQRTWPVVSRPYVRLALIAARVTVTDIPDGIRTVSEYNRPSNFHTLPARTQGWVAGLSVGMGVVLLGRLDLSYDWTTRQSYGGGRSTWSEIGFPSDDYLGYAYSGHDSTLCAAFNLRRGASTPYVVTGVRFYRDRLASGFDAFGEFGEQHAWNLRGSSPVVGVGLRLGPLELEADWSRIHSVEAAHPRARHLRFNVRYTLLRPAVLHWNP